MRSIGTYLGLLLAILAGAPGRADTIPECIDLSLAQPSESTALPTAIVQVRNGCGTPFLVAYVNCTWRDGDGESVGDGQGEVMNLEPGKAGEARIINWMRPDDFDHVDCAIRSTVSNEN